MFASTAWAYALLSLGEHIALLLITLVTLAVNCALVPILGSSSGAEGAATGTFVADVVMLVALGLWLQRTQPHMPPDSPLS
jgi:Na+-driven multidrug efflux pump